MNKAQKEKLHTIIDGFAGKSVGVVGDIMLDHYIHGDATRMSQEAPAPILRAERESFVLGGAANTAANLRAFGAGVMLIGPLGRDEEARAVKALCKKEGIACDACIESKARSTTTKTRLIAKGQQIARIDRESVTPLSPSEEKQILRAIEKHIPEWHVLVISDYAKGGMTQSLAKECVRLARRYNMPIIVDTKPQHFYFFRNATAYTPNIHEAEAVFGSALANEKDIRDAGRFLQKKTKANILITRGADGMTLFQANRTYHIPSSAREVYDVTGAGDTVIAAFALALAGGASFSHSATIANTAAGVVVGKQGTATVSQAEVKSALL
ncbi:MAG: D-glycero-beta-D-manno-heptose-7-phosphate kinase [Candidatus Niyogibacteria bacterium CG10_big_fil_rev_8_21_14_0_10_46_36]|uniref:D-glycero-beta-D-manno-heptose-7-phosphate kinase n=1 Tax=Candidatus Niyogibacteria bacterium CG10_big_fil_rev_8_21_14_0_10_46_36 TaxID=1974726 RepID=A0A2H0TFC5_9BACT|nr:MAG: D-glycero-beta-D-manno-heptose-7-phosphate kinase [Candidatus Niyogibacteria bacterium CG10_big_fil_rev_8_21_14_0_10_46_36]